MSTVRALLICLALLTPQLAFASAATDATSTCLVDSTNGKDRKLLARWIFLAMAQHPTITQLSRATSADLDQVNRDMGALFTRLVADDCPAQIKAMIAAEGPSSIEIAFEFLGKMAMQELMADPRVGATFSGIDAFVDQERIRPVVSPAE